MKRHWDTVIAGIGFALGVAAMAGSVFTEEFAHAAGAEARGYDALFHSVEGARCATMAVPATLVARNEMDS
jgi:hypothetical protein